MLLKSLEIKGFKTFPDKTTLSFDKGITAVVGPNGSGKSNISDAVCWVLGEQSTRTLRCTKMEDVIFNGSPSRKPQGFAEVTLNIDNTSRHLPFDGDSIAVTRRFYRSGESEYLINKTSVRLKDINELFMDTGLGRFGYSIIGQGKIDSIVSARSQDRREIFEEAAGISRFRYRKEESEHKLEQTEENLLRLQDILSELENRVGPLKEQSDKAQKYLTYSEEKRTLEISLWLNTLDKSSHILREHDDKILIARNQHNSIEQELNKIDKDIEEIFTQSASCTAKVDEVRQQSAKLEESAAKKDGEVSVLQNDIFHNNENVERIKAEIEKSTISSRDLDIEIAEKNIQVEKKTKYINEQNTQFQEFTNQLNKLRSGMDEKDKKINVYSRQLADFTARATQEKLKDLTASSSITEIKIRLANLEQSLKAKKEQCEKLKTAGEDYKKMLADTDESIKSLVNSVKGYDMKLQTRRKKMEEIKQQNDNLHLDTQECLRRANLLEALERNLEGFSHSVKIVMKEFSRGILKGIHGPVSRLINVPPKYSVAIETALGGAMQNIVVGNENDAKYAIQLLKRKDSGRATFLPLSTIKGRVLHESGLENCEGFIGTAGELCTCDEKYKEILNSLLGRIAVAEDLDSAVSIAKKFGYRFRIVTLDGQVVNTGGSLTGGSLNKNSGLLSRASDIKRIKSHAEKLQMQEKETAELLKTVTQEVASAEKELSAAKEKLTLVQEERYKINSELMRDASDLKDSKHDIASLDEENKKALMRIDEQEKIRQQAKEQAEIIEEKQKELEKQISQVSGSRSELSETCNKISENLQEIRIACLAAKKDIESLQLSINEINNRKLDHEGKTETLKKEIERLEVINKDLNIKIDNLKKQAETMRNEAKNSDEKIKQLNARRMEYEHQSMELRNSEREKSSQKEKVGHELARLEERKANFQKAYDEIISRLWEEYELTRREAEKIGKKVENEAEAKKNLNQLKSKIKTLGTVNVAAVEEYKEVSQRYEFMKTQLTDIETSRNQLRKLINDLTRQMRELFSEKFKEINDNFKDTFRELFSGGTAELSLTAEDDILNSGIEITVQPPGKIVTHLESLSGGEKSLVAIALYFAIMKVNPPPFCVLDEIEAALDDVNVDRFAAYLRRMTDNTQFIVITHRRGSMEEADVLYGVTMQDEGISKLLELRLSDIQEKLGIK